MNLPFPLGDDREAEIVITRDDDSQTASQDGAGNRRSDDTVERCLVSDVHLEPPRSEAVNMTTKDVDTQSLSPGLALSSESCTASDNISIGNFL